MPEAKRYDLEERTSKFGERVIHFVKGIETTHITKPILTQLIKSATSIGANYCEADNAESRDDFKHKMSISKKEAKETMHWLRMVACAAPTHKDAARELWKEAKEINLICNAITRKITTKKDTKKPTNIA